MLSVSNSNYVQKIISLAAGLLLAVFALSAIGCSTTPTFKPTASVMVGAHKSL